MTPPQPVRARAETALLVGLLALGVLVRVQGITSHPLWIDEYGSWWAVAGEDFGDLWHRVIAIQGQSPLYYVFLRASLEALGPGTLALRLPSLIFGIGLLLCCVPLATALFGDRRIALTSLAAFAVNERLIFYSQEARPYALALLCAALSAIAWVALLRSPRSGRIRAGYLLATAAAFYAHYLFGLLVLFQATHALLRLRRTPRRDLRAWLVTALLLALLLAPGALQLVNLFGRRESLDWVDASGGAAMLRVLRVYFEGPVLGWTAAAALLAVIAGRRLGLPPSPSGSALVALWLGVPLLVLGLVPPLLGVSLLDPRYGLVALPAAALAYGVLIALPAAGTRLAWLPLVVFLVATTGLRLAPRFEQTGLFSARYHDEHWERAVDSLREHHRPGEPIFYATHYIELDAVVRGQASQESRDFSAWPVSAHLPAPERTSLRALPYSESAEMTPVLLARVDEAAAVPRSFVIGMQPVIAQLIRMAKRHPGVRIAGHERFGRIYLIQLRGRPG